MDLHKTRDFLSFEGILTKRKIPSKTYTHNFYVHNKLSDMIEKDKDLELNRKLIDCNYNINDAYHNIMSSNLTDYSEYDFAKIKEKRKKNIIKYKNKKGFEEFSPQHSDLMQLGVFPRTKAQRINSNSKKEFIIDNEVEEIKSNKNEEKNVLNKTIQEGQNLNDFSDGNLNGASENNYFDYNNFKNKKFSRTFQNYRNMSLKQDRERLRLMNNLNNNLNRFRTIKNNNLGIKRIMLIDPNNQNHIGLTEKKNASILNVSNSNHNFLDFNLSLSAWNPKTNFQKFLSKNNKHNQNYRLEDSNEKSLKILNKKSPWLQSLKVNCSNLSETSKNKNSFLGKNNKSGYVAIFHKNEKLYKRHETLKDAYFNNNKNLVTDSSFEEFKNKKLKNNNKSLKVINDSNKLDFKQIDKNDSGAKVSKKAENKSSANKAEKAINQISLNKDHNQIIENRFKSSCAISAKKEDQSIISFSPENKQIISAYKINNLNGFKEENLHKNVFDDEFPNKAFDLINKNKENKEKEKIEPNKKFSLKNNFKEALSSKHPASFLARCEKRRNSIINLMNFKIEDIEKEKKVFHKKTNSTGFQFNPFNSTNIKAPIIINKSSQNDINKIEQNCFNLNNDNNNKSQSKCIKIKNNFKINILESRNEIKINNQENNNPRRFVSLKPNLNSPFHKKTSSNLLINSATNIENITNKITKSLSKNIKKYKTIKHQIELKKEDQEDQSFITVKKKPKVSRKRNFMILSSIEEGKTNFSNLSENRRSLLKMADFIESMNDKIVLELKTQIEGQYKKVAQKNGLISVNERIEKKYAKILNNKNVLTNLTIEAKKLENSILNTRSKIEKKYFTTEEREKMKVNCNIKK